MNDMTMSGADPSPDQHEMHDPFEEERRHLKATLAKLSQAIDHASGLFDQTNDAYRSTKFYMSENRGEIDPQEMYQNELFLKEVDRNAELAHLSRERLTRLYDSPYFARVAFRAQGESEAKASYIGPFAFSHNGAIEISDWRSPVAGLFYDYDIGSAAYDAPSGHVTGTLEGKRQIKVENSELVYAVDDDSGIRDEVMQRELSRTSDSKMRSIISSIQKEQNRIIRDESGGTLIIQGVAGSGKTSIALHRIAYLLYRRKGSLDSNSIAILSPNKVFGDYISNVLPELGEEPVREMDVRGIAQSVLGPTLHIAAQRYPVDDADPAWLKRAQYKGTPEFAEAIAAYAEQFRAKALTGRDLSFGSVTFEGAWLTERYQSFGRLTVKERIELLASEIVVEVTAKSIGRRVTVPKKSEVRQKLNTMLAAKDALGLYRLFLADAQAKRHFVMAAKGTIEWEDACPIAYLQSAFDGFEELAEIKHLLIDEMQDLTPVQHMLIARLFPCEKTILGDFNQRVDPANGMTLEAMREIYGNPDVFRLTRSYRSTLEINELAQKVKPALDIDPLKRHGSPVGFVRCGDTQGVLAQLDEAIAAFEASGFKTLGIIHKSDTVARVYHELLLRDHRARLISDESATFSDGVSVASIKMSKGLEFDEVIILDADRNQYASEYERSLLYVAITRAMHKLTILYRNEPSTFLAN
ncbi:HelD family protein [Raoultibacter phocaeensis]|uniref:HelD family protein n=1 Tax=Raoultibacter phocaeensis TaxID=2479841 RepID=UPI00111B04F7|nr:UvrD-helicase domain-containing protein [Raoultibacter phocaeensis]